MKIVDGKGKFFKTLNLDKTTRKLIREYRKFKPELLKDTNDRTVDRTRN